MKESILGSALLIPAPTESKLGRVIAEALAMAHRGPRLVTTISFDTGDLRKLTVQWHRGRRAYRWYRHEAEACPSKVEAQLDCLEWRSYDALRTQFTTGCAYHIKKEIGRFDAAILTPLVLVD